MRTAVLLRTEQGDEGTFGTFTLDDGRKFYSGELPWRDNLRGLSCIPSGSYEAHWMNSPTHGMCYHVLGVKGRSEIEIHSANWMGDKQLGKKCDMLGCIGLGKVIGTLDKQRALISSKAAIEEFHNDMKGETFQLIVHDVMVQEIIPGFHGGVDA